MNVQCFAFAAAQGFADADADALPQLVTYLDAVLASDLPCFVYFLRWTHPLRQRRGDVSAIPMNLAFRSSGPNAAAEKKSVLGSVSNHHLAINRVSNFDDITITSVTKIVARTSAWTT